MKIKHDEIFDLIDKELVRQTDGLEMIPSENYVSPAVRKALGSVLTNKYSEGYPGRRYYAGNEYIDRIETIAVNRAKKIFGVPHANVQPYSGTPANLAVYLACCRPGDPIMGLNLPDGGHLSHGWKVSASSIFYKSIPYHVMGDGRVDFDEVWKLAKENRPRLIWCGATAYVFQYEFEKFAEIADEVGAYLAADIAHIAGLVVGGVHPSPVPYAHLITTTTHKTLRGPRGAMIMVTPKGLEKDPDLAAKVDKAVFPGLQGGPHDHQTAAIAVALAEASTPEFKKYAYQILKNAQYLAKALIKLGFKLVGNGTENHLILADLVPVFGPGGGVIAEEALAAAGITVNKNTVPKDPSSPFYPSGIRLGTPALTSRGMRERDMEQIALWIGQVIGLVTEYRLPDDKTGRQKYVARIRDEIYQDAGLLSIRTEIKSFCRKFPLP